MKVDKNINITKAIYDKSIKFNEFVSLKLSKLILYQIALFNYNNAKSVDINAKLVTIKKNKLSNF